MVSPSIGPFLALTPQAIPPQVGWRVVSGLVWWTLIFVPWLQYRAAITTGSSATPPTLAPPGASGVYFTDQQSLLGCATSASYAYRLGLYSRDQLHCQLYGCALIQFPVPQNPAPRLPPQSPGAASQGLTANGAREWIATGNVPLGRNMVVTYVEPLGTTYQVIL